jgi:hypothetical protein
MWTTTPVVVLLALIPTLVLSACLAYIYSVFRRKGSSSLDVRLFGLRFTFRHEDHPVVGPEDAITASRAIADPPEASGEIESQQPVPTSQATAQHWEVP